MFFRTLLVTVLSTLGFAAPSKSDTLSTAQVIAAVRDLSGGDQKAIAIARSALAGHLPADSAYSELPDEMRVFAIIAASLDGAGRMVSIDWAESVDESAKAFASLFINAGLDPSNSLMQLKGVKSPERGNGVGIAYLAFRAQAEALAIRIIGLNADSDEHHFVVVSQPVAEKWQSVRIGDNQYIEDVDWQFLQLVEAAGIIPRSIEHPSRTERLAPKR